MLQCKTKKLGLCFVFTVFVQSEYNFVTCSKLDEVQQAGTQNGNNTENKLRTIKKAYRKYL